MKTKFGTTFFLFLIFIGFYLINDSNANKLNNKPPSIKKETSKINILKVDEKNAIKDEIVEQTNQPLPGNYEVEAIDENARLKINTLEVEVTLYDGDLNQVLADLELESKYFFGTGKSVFEKYVTDKRGKFIFNVKKMKLITLQILVGDFAFYSNQIKISEAKTFLSVKLYKGVKLEVRAINSEKNVVEKLIAKRWPGKYQSVDELPIIYDAIKKLYVITNIPEGMQEFSFQAPGYQESYINRIWIDSKQENSLVIRLLPISTILFELKNEEKFDSINISKIKVVDYAIKNTTSTSLEPIKILKNQKGFFEFEISSPIASLTISADHYKPQTIILSPNQNLYQINLKKYYEGELKIINQKGNDIVGAMVTYGTLNFKSMVKSDENGIAKLTDLNAMVRLNIHVSHDDYALFSEQWQFDFENEKSKTITLKDGGEILGKVTTDEKPVQGAEVYLKRKYFQYPFMQATTEADGSFHFKNIEYLPNKEIIVRALHPEIGMAESEISFIPFSQVTIDLSLVKERSLLIKLVDSQEKALLNKNISLTSNFENKTVYCNVSNENGEYEFFNLMRGDYSVKLVDETYKIKEVNIKVPNQLLVLTAQSKIKKIIATTKGGVPFKGEIKASKLCMQQSIPLEIKYSDDGAYYLNTGDDNGGYILVFEASGFAMVGMGPFNSAIESPINILIEFQEGLDFKVKVVDQEFERPIPFAMVKIFPKNCSSIYQLKPTNEQGEVIFNRLNGELLIECENYDYVKCRQSIDTANANELTLKLRKGGVVKGHFTPAIDERQANITLGYVGHFSLFEEGDFEWRQVEPGNYKLDITKILVNEGAKHKKIKIVIEKDTVLEVNLDEN